MTFPSSGGEVLHGVVETICLQVGFLKHQDGVSLCPNPVLYFLAKEGDIAEEQLQNLLRLLGLLGQSLRNLNGRVRDQFRRTGEDQPDLRDLLHLLRRDEGNRSGVGFIVPQPVGIVYGQDALVMTILMAFSLVQNHSHDLVGGIVHIDAILREGDVESRGNFNFSMMLGPLPLMVGGPLQIQDQPPWGPIQVLSIALICPVVDEVVQGGKGRIVGEE